MTRSRAPRTHGYRRQARSAALKTLYEVDLTGHDVEETLARNSTAERLPDEAVVFAHELVDGTLSHVSEIDERIQAAASEWPLAQMARIDKSILRLAIYEILYNNSVPAKAAINEAVELAKTFGSDTSSRFVNGVLGAIYQEAPQSPTEPQNTAEGEVP